MDSEWLLNFSNFTTLFVCMVLKFPQIFAVVSAKSSAGVSVKSLQLELTGYLVFLSYQMYYSYPPATYLEYPILIAQDAVLLMLIFYYNGKLNHGLISAFIYAVGWHAVTLHKWIIDLAMSLCTFISAASKFAQLQCLWEAQDAGQVSALTWGMALYTCLTRIVTTIITTGDLQVLARFIILATLNAVVTFTILHYRRVGKKQQ
ncbi:solute carrier family 66 member 3 [Erpetoichthys calabaricus]|uniref:Solute carrier family 66 member 3 n=1 Tax=Erpetoichthys calabaricus TaxID=27687 RepID=A0A8C4SB76_ERPCA|nr:solute carrier family 66 member 3 [Erpetoichthys calabaricus]